MAKDYDLTEQPPRGVVCDCGELGWEHKRDAQQARRGEITRLRTLGISPMPAVMVRRCDRSELAHVRVSKVSKNDGRQWDRRPELQLPSRPYEPVPGMASAEILGYLTAVRTELVLAIDQQGPDHLLPGARTMGDHYGIPRNAVQKLQRELRDEDRAIRKEDKGDRYVTVRREHPNNGEES